MLSMLSPFLQRRQQPLQQQILSHIEGFSESIFMASLLSTFRRLNALPIFRNGQQQQLPHFWPLVSGCVDDFPAIIWALSDLVLPQQDDNPQQSFLFLVISFMLELRGKEIRKGIWGHDVGDETCRSLWPHRPPPIVTWCCKSLFPDA